MSERYPFPADRYLLVGRVSKPHGLKGEMKVFPHPGQAAHIMNYSRAALVAADGRMTALLDLLSARPAGKKIILKLDTIDTKSEAELTVDMGLIVPLEDAVGQPDLQLPLLIGRRVRLAGQERVIGTIEDFFDNGAQDILVVRDAETEYLIPAVDSIVVEIDDEEVLIDPPAGLLELSSSSEGQEEESG